MEEEAMHEATKEKHIWPYTTLLSPFIEAAEEALEMRGLDEGKRKEILRDLLDHVDGESVRFLVRVARTGAWTMGEELRIYLDERRPYAYLWTKALLEETDREGGVVLLREDTEKGYPFLRIHPEDLVAVYAHLRERYRDPMDWESFLDGARALVRARYPKH